MRMTACIAASLAVCALCACGHTSPSATAAAAAQQGTAIDDAAAVATSPAAAFVCDSSAPLSASDIALYLSVMRAAAALVQHPTAADIAARQGATAQASADGNAFAADQHQNGDARASADAANQALAAAMQAAQQSGDYSAVPAAAKAAKDANAALAEVPSETPAQQAEGMRVMELDSGMADQAIIAERSVDSERWDCITRKVEDAVPGPDAVYGDGDPMVLTARQRRDEATYAAEVAANKALLAQHLAEIRSLEKIVRARHGGDTG